jgi:hypothetical protein
MPGIELKAFWELERLGCLKVDEFYSPSKAEELFYSTKLRHTKDLFKQQQRPFYPLVRK